MAQKEKVRVELSILAEDYETLKQTAEDRGLTLSNYLKSVLAIERYIKAKQESGASFILQEERRFLKIFPETVQHEILFR